MPKYFRRRRLNHARQKHHAASTKFLFIIALLVLIILLFPLFRLLVGPAAGFVWRAPEILGSRYVILLQNEAELRPSGGFLSAFAIVDISGLSPRIEIFDSYAVAAPQSPIAAPDALEAVFSADPKYVGWEFRDANFSPDFATSARQAITFLQQDARFADLSFDGVIAVNFAAIEELIERFDLHDADEQSLFLSLQRETKDIDLHSLEALQTRKDSLALIAERLRDKLGYFALPAIADVMAAAADRKDIQFWFAADGLMSYAERKGWDGSLGDGDVFAVNVANLGAKKSDRYVRRQLYSDVFVAPDGSTLEKFRLEMHNTGSPNLLSGSGTYLVRLFRPRGTTLIDNDGEWQRQSLVYGEEFFRQVRLDPGQRVSLAADFTLPFSWKSGEQSFDWRKQSGTADRLFLTLHGAGESAFATTDCDRVVSREQILFCETLLTTDTHFDITLVPDTLSPILENILIQNTREIFVRFSEPIAADVPTDAVRLRCELGEFVPQAIISNPDDLRDRTLVFPQPLTLDGEFCRFVWRNVGDLFGNTRDIQVTLPLRPPA